MREGQKREKCQHKKFVTVSESINISTNVNVLKKRLDDFQITSIICIFIVIAIYSVVQWYIYFSNDD